MDGLDPTKIQADPRTVLALYLSAERDLEEAKANLNAARHALQKLVFPAYEEGKTLTANIDHFVLKGKAPVYRNIDKAALPAVLRQLPREVGDTCIDYKPQLILKEYKKLSKAHKLLLDEAIRESEGTISIKVTERKRPEEK